MTLCRGGQAEVESQERDSIVITTALFWSPKSPEVPLGLMNASSSGERLRPNLCGSCCRIRVWPASDETEFSLGRPLRPYKLKSTSGYYQIEVNLDRRSHEKCAHMKTNNLIINGLLEML